MGIIIALYGLEWQKLPDVPVGRGDDMKNLNLINLKLII
jgi:hypothetical protein